MARPILLALFCLVLASCGTMKDGGSQEITVETPGANDAVCYLDNKHMKYRLFTPGKVVVARRPGDLVVTCIADGNREKTVVYKEQINKEAAYGNAITAGLGAAWDYETGGLFDYPERIVVDFTNIPSQRMALPNYDRHIRANPDLYGMEEFRPGNAVLMSDKHREPHQLKRKDMAGGNDLTPALSGFTTSDGTADTRVIIGSDTAPAPSSPYSSGSSAADSLTRSMNPNVFDGSAPSSSGFVGGVNSGNAPVTLHPAR